MIFIKINKTIFKIRMSSKDVTSIVFQSADVIPVLTNFGRIMEETNVLVIIGKPLQPDPLSPENGVLTKKARCVYCTGL